MTLEEYALSGARGRMFLQFEAGLTTPDALTPQTLSLPLHWQQRVIGACEAGAEAGFFDPAAIQQLVGIGEYHR